MTAARLQTIVAEAVAIDREIRTREVRLRELKTLIVEEARRRGEAASPTEHGGSSIVLEGEGDVARVTFPAPAIKSRIDEESRDFPAIRQTAGKHFDQLFTPSGQFHPVPEFRALAEALCGRAAGKLIKLCSRASAATVAFETKTPV